MAGRTSAPMTSERRSIHQLIAPTCGSVAVAVGGVLCLQALSRWIQGCISWEIVDPASNHVGWYIASLKHAVLSWIWPSAFLVWWATRDYARSWLVLFCLIFAARGGPEATLWQGSLTHEEMWLIGLSSWYHAIAEDTVQAMLALVAVRYPCVLPFVLLTAALRIFL